MSNRIAVFLVTVVVAVGLLAGGAFLPPLVADMAETATGEKVAATRTTMHVDRTGRPTVVGEVLNRRGDAVDGVTVEVTFTEDGEPIGTGTATAIGTPIAADETAPFAVRGEEGTTPDGYEIDLRYESVERSNRASLSITDSEVDDSAQDQVVVTGTVANGDDDAVAVGVAATFYDESGSVIGVRAVRTSPGTVAAGERASFRIRFRTLGDVPSRAREYADYSLRPYVYEQDGDTAGTSETPQPS